MLWKCKYPESWYSVCRTLGLVVKEPISLGPKARGPGEETLSRCCGGQHWFIVQGGAVGPGWEQHWDYLSSPLTIFLVPCFPQGHEASLQSGLEGKPRVMVLCPPWYHVCMFLNDTWNSFDWSCLPYLQMESLKGKHHLREEINLYLHTIHIVPNKFKC